MQLTAITTSQHFIQAFSWMLIHSLWQGLLLSVMAGLLLSLNKKASSAVRYNLVLAQLLLFVAACDATFLWEWYKTPIQNAGIYIAALPTGDTALSVKSFVNSCVAYFTANSPIIVLLWFILFLIRTVRMMGSALFINRARHRFIYQPSDAWKEKVNNLCGKLQLKRAVKLLESGYVNVPMVIGHLKPVILIPVGLLAGLPPGQVEAVLLHELAHIRRNDYVVNCLQTIVETVFFFNPGLLWISSVLRDERENCCDDIALAQTQNKKEFVQALISFKEYALKRQSYAVAFPGNKNSLLNRASRILHNQNKPLGTGEKVFFFAGILVLSIVVATASIAQMHILQKVKSTIQTVSHQQQNSPRPLDEHFRAITQHQSAIKHTEKKPVPEQQHTGNYTYTPPKGSADAHPPKAPQQEPPLPPEPISAERALQQRVDVRQQATVPNEQKRVAIEREQSLKDQQQQQARDAEQAKKDQEQAILDQQQANKDQQQAHIDEGLAKRDQESTQKAQQQQQEWPQKKEEAMKNNPNPPH